MRELGECVPIQDDKIEELVAFAKENDIDLYDCRTRIRFSFRHQDAFFKED